MKSRVQFLSIVFSQLQALVVRSYYVLVTDLLSPRSEKVSWSLMLGVVSFLLAAVKGITASKLTFII